jgi:hypothetical protein
VQSVTGVRNALDKRLHNAIFGDALHAERVLKQFSYIRTGKLANINLLHLIDKDGGFKYDDPLASFATFAAKDAGIHFRDAFERLSQCINIATPSLGPAAQRFLPALKTVVVEHIDLGVDWKQISRYYASVMHKVSQPTRAWSVGSTDGNRLASFNIDWIEQSTKIHRELDQAAQAKRAKDEVILAMASRKREVMDVDDDHVVSKSKAKRLKKEAAALAKKTATTVPNKTVVATVVASGARGSKTHGAGVDASGTHVPPPHIDPAFTTAKERQDAWTAFNTLHPRGSKGNRCWDFWHSQGCSSSNCKFDHSGK